MITVDRYCLERSKYYYNIGHKRTAENYNCYAKRFKKDMGEIPLKKLTRDDIIVWRDIMLNEICKNTCNFYLRGVKASYNHAVDCGIIKDKKPFHKVSCNNEKTIHRALSLQQLKELSKVDCMAVHFFLLSFYLRGMAPVDIRKLRKNNVRNNHINYRRSKTKQELSIRIEPEIQRIIDIYTADNEYLVDVPCNWDNINKKLKSIGNDLGIPFPLTMYCLRHSELSYSLKTNRLQH